MTIIVSCSSDPLSILFHSRLSHCLEVTDFSPVAKILYAALAWFLDSGHCIRTSFLNDTKVSMSYLSFSTCFIKTASSPQRENDGLDSKDIRSTILQEMPGKRPSKCTFTACVIFVPVWRVHLGRSQFCATSRIFLDRSYLFHL